MFGVFGTTFTSVDYRFNVGVSVVGLEGEDVGFADCIREAENRNFEYGFQEWATFHIFKRLRMEVLEKALVYPYTHFVGFFQK
jgi:hypothetical protein